MVASGSYIDGRRCFRFFGSGHWNRVVLRDIITVFTAIPVAEDVCLHMFQWYLVLVVDGWQGTFFMIIVTSV